MMLRATARLMMIVATLSVASRVGAATIIVDTGTPNDHSDWTFSSADSGFVTQYFAAEFSTTDTYGLLTVEGYFGNQFGVNNGQVAIGIHADDAAGGETPGTLVFSSTLNLAAGAPLDWRGVTMSVLLSPGTYWASYIPIAGVSGSMPGEAPFPLPNYAFGQGGPWNPFDPLAAGIRISGDPLISAVPDSTSTFGLMLIVGVLGLAAYRWRLRAA